MERPEWLLTITEADYHEARAKYVTSHGLIDFCRCPLAYHLRETGVMKRKESSGYALGSATHALVLEGQSVFDDQYTVADGPINPKTDNPYGRETKKFAEWMATQDKAVVATADYAMMSEIRDNVMRHPKAVELLSHGLPEGTIRATLEEVDMQMRLDWFSDRSGITDLKTCLDLDRFEYDARDYDYVRQLSVYAAGVMVSSGEIPQVHLIAAEKKEPYRVGVWRIPDELIETGIDSVRGSLRELKRCYANNTWPTGYEEVRRLFDK